jgi:hypothetical protein
LREPDRDNPVLSCAEENPQPSPAAITDKFVTQIPDLQRPLIHRTQMYRWGATVGGAGSPSLLNGWPLSATWTS